MKKFTLLACAIMSVAMAPAAELEYSYNPNGLDPQWYGTSKKENYDIAVKIDNPGLAGARITSISVPVNGADNLYGSASAFLTSKLVVERIDGVRVNVPDICSVEATISNGILTATFDEPYTLTSEPIYVGYSIEVAELQTDTKAPIAVVAGDNPDGFWFHSTRTQLKWDNYVNKDKAGLQSAMSIMLDGNFDAATASISLPERTLMITNQENEYSFEVINGGVTEISNVGYSWKIGDISGEGTYEFPTPVRNAIGASGTVSFTVPAVEENGKNKISITLDKVNGSANPNLSASDEANVVSHPLFLSTARWWRNTPACGADGAYAVTWLLNISERYMERISWLLHGIIPTRWPSLLHILTPSPDSRWPISTAHYRSTPAIWAFSGLRLLKRLPTSASNVISNIPTIQNPLSKPLPPSLQSKMTTLLIT